MTLCVFCPLHSFRLIDILPLISFLFPEVYTKGTRPPKCGVRDKERYSLATPAYGFGWVIPAVELYEAINPGVVPLAVELSSKLYKAVDTIFYQQWQKNGFERFEYKLSDAYATRISLINLFLFIVLRHRKP